MNYKDENKKGSKISSNKTNNKINYIDSGEDITNENESESEKAISCFDWFVLN